MAFIDTDQRRHRRGDAREGQAAAGALRMAKAALMNREVEKRPRARRCRGAAGDRVADQAAARLDRTVPEGRTRGARAQGSRRRSRCSRAYLPPPMDPAELDARRRRGDRGDRGDSAQGHGQGDEGGDGRARRARTVDGKVVNELVRRKLGRVKIANLFRALVRLIDLKGTHKPLIHPPLGSCRKAGAFFLFSTRSSFRYSAGVRIVRNRTP